MFAREGRRHRCPGGESVTSPGNDAGPCENASKGIYTEEEPATGLHEILQERPQHSKEIHSTKGSRNTPLQVKLNSYDPLIKVDNKQ